MPTWTLPVSFVALPFPLTLELALIAGRAFALVGALLVFAWAFGRWRKAQARDAARVFEQLDLVRGELRGLSETVGTLTARLEQLAEKVAAEAQRAPVQAHGPQRAYENAIRQAERGAPASEIVTNCGVPRQEAELLVRLHGTGQGGPRAVDNGQETAADPVTVSGHKRRLSVVG